jgi:hypothetical protein
MGEAATTPTRVRRMIQVKCTVVGIVQMEVRKRRVKMMRLMMLFAGEASSFYTFCSIRLDLSISQMLLWLHPSRPNVRYRDSYHRDLMMAGVSSDSCKNEVHANTSICCAHMHRQTIQRVWFYIRLVANVTSQHPSWILQCHPSNNFMNRMHLLLSN